MLGEGSARGRLVLLELENFKSYAGTQRVGPFEDAFAAVIGPNGAGKSNLMDALSFVLGVSSAALRSAQYAELVHRPTMGGVRPSSACVSAHYERADGTRVVFSRRAFAAGGCEYRVDGSAVPAAEYARVWACENVLARARNFLVFQGDVDAVAARSPRDVARLLEAVSGSEALREPYERARTELDGALEEAAGNFARRRGLGAELRAVQGQRADAARYATLLRVSADARARLFLARLYGVDGALEDIRAALPSLAEGVSLAEENLRVAASADSAGDDGGLQRAVLAAEKDDRAAVRALDAAVPRMVAAEEEGVRAERRIASLSAARSAAENALSALLDGVCAAQTARDDAQRALDAIPAATAAVPVAVAEEYRVLRAAGDQAGARARLRAESAAHRLAPARASAAVLDAKAAELGRALSRAERVEREALLSASSARRESEDAAASAEDAARAIAEADARRRHDEDAQAELTERLRGTASALLAAGAAAADGEREARVRVAIAALRRAHPGAVHGRLVDIVRPSSRKYAAAAAAALGNALDAVVVSDERTAVACLSILRDQRLPRLTLLPLDVLGASPAPLAGAFVPARDVLRFDAAFGRAVDWAVGRVAVCATISEARAVLAAAPMLSRVVTEDGCVVHRGGRITGGSAPPCAASDTPFHASDVEQLRTERDEILDALRVLANRLQRTDADASLRSRALEAVARRDAAIAAAEREDRRALSAAHEAEHIRDALGRVARERETLLASVAADEEDERTALAEVSSALDAVLGPFLAQLDGSVSASLLAADSAPAVRLAAEEALAKATARLAFATGQRDDARSRLDECTAQLEACSRAIAENALARDALAAEVAALRQRREHTLYALSSAREALAARTAEIAHRRGVLAAAQDALAQASRAHAAAQVDADRLALERSRILRDAALEDVAVPVGPGGSIDYASLGVAERSRTKKSPKTPAVSVAAIEDELAQATAEMERIAPNLRAQDAIDGAEGRLRETLDACERAKDRLRVAKDAFASVRAERTARFAAALSHVASHIDPIYKALTRTETHSTGGAAFLAPENADEPYLEGVRFHAMPPMKRFLDMDQLSGGERAVASLALLFAIQSFRPAPFFVLDEVDAALDAGNVARLAAFVRSWARGTLALPPAASQAPTGESAAALVLPPTQFVVISLKAAMYEHADALVGVLRDPQTASSRTLAMRLAEFPE